MLSKNYIFFLRRSFQQKPAGGFYEIILITSILQHIPGILGRKGHSQWKVKTKTVGWLYRRHILSEQFFFMRKTVKNDNYNNNTIRREISHQQGKKKNEDNDYVSHATLPYIWVATERIGRPHNNKEVAKNPTETPRSTYHIIWKLLKIISRLDKYKNICLKYSNYHPFGIFNYLIKSGDEIKLSRQLLINIDFIF